MQHWLDVGLEDGLYVAQEEISQRSILWLKVVEVAGQVSDVGRVEADDVAGEAEEQFGWSGWTVGCCEELGLERRREVKVDASQHRLVDVDFARSAALRTDLLPLLLHIRQLRLCTGLYHDTPTHTNKQSVNKHIKRRSFHTHMLTTNHIVQEIF